MNAKSRKKINNRGGVQQYYQRDDGSSSTSSEQSHVIRVPQHDNLHAPRIMGIPPIPPPTFRHVNRSRSFPREEIGNQRLTNSIPPRTAETEEYSQYPQHRRTPRDNLQYKRPHPQEQFRSSAHPRNELILPPKSHSRNPSTSSSSSTRDSTVSDSTRTTTGAAVVQKIFRVMEQRTQRIQPKVEPNTEEVRDTASSFARTAPKAGYLQKLGGTNHQYKRRFFVLKPTTHLYYFLSPNDAEPRGCIDLESRFCRIREREVLPDGRFRFEVCVNEHLIVLEARSEEVGREWMRCLERERLSFVKGEVENLKREKSELEKRVEELESHLEEFRLVERDRDGAIQDAGEWREKFCGLNEALRLLTRQMRRFPDEEEKKEEQDGSSEAPTPVTEDESEDSKDSNDLSDKKSMSFATVSEEERQLEELDLGRTNFSALSNACQMLKESLRLTSMEANKAVDEVHEANKKVVTLQKRMTKAERLLCKLWEENCSLRDTIKQKRLERKVLVKEVKSLQEITKQNDNPEREDTTAPNSNSSVASQNSQQTSNPQDKPPQNNLGNEEKRLIMELEDHVISSLRLHEKFLSANGCHRRNSKPVAQETTVKRANSTYRMTSQQYTQCMIDDVDLYDNESTTSSSGLNESFSPIRPRLLLANQSYENLDGESATSDVSCSIDQSYSELVKKKSLYEDSCDEEDVNDEIEEGKGAEAMHKEEKKNYIAAQFSSYQQKNYDPVRFPPNPVEKPPPIRRSDPSHLSGGTFPQNPINPDGTKRQHPLLQLDDDSIPPNLCSSSSQSSASIITQNGKATSTLICPLADVRSETSNSELGEDGQVYHLTFHSQKIGLQFQKVPTEPGSSGALTVAMTTDFSQNHRYKTDAELKRIAAISDSDFPTCPVATPVDAVLVCGFHGFSDASSNPRPKMGARLVAFDGISVEIGRWTFESVKKAIQARGRPLTLSFRNDYLTMKQRSILTKAVSDIEGKGRPPVARVLMQRPIPLCPLRGIHNQSPSVSEYRRDFHPKLLAENENLDTSGSNFSASSADGSRNDYRSFSDPGSSILSSTIAPLVAGLMSTRSETYTPQYLRETKSSLESIPHHEDFKASLL